MALPASCLFVSTHYCCIDSLGPVVCLLRVGCVSGQNSHDVRGTGVTQVSQGRQRVLVLLQFRCFSWTGALVHCLLLLYTQHDVATAVLLCCKGKHASCLGTGRVLGLVMNSPPAAAPGGSVHFFWSLCCSGTSRQPSPQTGGLAGVPPPAAAGTFFSGPPIF